MEKNHRSSRKQYIDIDSTTKTSFEKLKCGFPQESILAPLLLLLHANDLKNASSLFNPMMFADDENLFYTNRNIHSLFLDGNKELANINERSLDNKLSLNVKKQVLFFHRPSKKENIPPQ